MSSIVTENFSHPARAATIYTAKGNVDSEARQFSERKEASIISSNMHAEVIAARLAYLGGTPTTKPNPIFVGGSVKEMLQTDVKAVCVV